MSVSYVTQRFPSDSRILVYILVGSTTIVQDKGESFWLEYLVHFANAFLTQNRIYTEDPTWNRRTQLQGINDSLLGYVLQSYNIHTADAGHF